MSTRSATGFVSDQQLSEKEFIAQYMPKGIFTEEYLKARHWWLTQRRATSEERNQVMMDMHDAYEKTEAYQIHRSKMQA